MKSLFLLIFALACMLQAQVTITGLTIDGSITSRASGADNWPHTWADDNNCYTAAGDNTGAFQSTSTKYSCIIARVSGMPPSISGTDVKYLFTGDGRSGKKGSGMLYIDNTLYMFVRNADNAGHQSQLGWSTDYGKNWSWASWKFEELGYCCILNFGKAYAGSRDDYVYVYSPNINDAYLECDEVVLARVPRAQIKNESAYQFVSGFDGSGNPAWSNSISSRAPVFTLPGGCNRMDVSYIAPAKVYIMTMRSRAKNGGLNHFSIHYAPEPWGPWTQIHYQTCSSTSSGWPGEVQHFPTKFMSADGKTLWMVSAANDAYSMQKVYLQWEPAVTDDTPPSDVIQNDLVVDGQNITVSWQAATDAESGIDGYKIYRSTSAGATTLLTTVGSTQSYQDNTGTSGTTYYYRIKAVNGARLESQNYSNEKSATTAADLEKPQIVDATAVSETGIRVRFSEPVDVSGASFTLDQGLSVTAANLLSDQATVELTVSAMTVNTEYQLSVSGVRDKATAPNTMDPAVRSVLYSGALTIGNTIAAGGGAYVWDTLASGKTVYIDRAYTFTTVPPAYQDLPYLQTANDDKARTDNPMVTFSINLEATVYVGFAGTSPPAWLSGWTSTGDQIVTTDRTFQLYEKTFAAGTVLLGGNENAAQSMYTVVVRKAAGTTVNLRPQAAGPSGPEVSASPNPFNPAVVISISDGHVGPTPRVAPTLAIYNIHGRMVHRAGNIHTDRYVWNASGLPSGPYLIRVGLGQKTLCKKVVLAK
jgi:hypothetical protein